MLFKNISEAEEYFNKNLLSSDDVDAEEVRFQMWVEHQTIDDQSIFREPTSETQTRSLLKTVTWRIIGTLITWYVIYYYTQSFGGSIKTTLVAAFWSMLAYYLHERYWNSIKWGKLN